ncbi:hypothetical protein [Altererythrobacter sp. GH1-8]|uniref:hypothetical protein n=1 Tax=Altererythrobacter sp. GH1-8 TaxID=3349333 RepID=UPI00374CAC84
MTQDHEVLAEVVELATERHWLAGLSLPDAKSKARAEVLARSTPLQRIALVRTTVV